MVDWSPSPAAVWVRSTFLGAKGLSQPPVNIVIMTATRQVMILGVLWSAATISWRIAL